MRIGGRRGGHTYSSREGAKKLSYRELRDIPIARLGKEDFLFIIKQLLYEAKPLGDHGGDQGCGVRGDYA